MNWYGSSRSNYVRVKDPSAFRRQMEEIDVTVGTEVAPDGGTLFAVFAPEGQWPRVPSNNGPPVPGEEELTAEDDLDFLEILAAHLADGEVAVVQIAGGEGSRSVSGAAIAFTNTDDRVVIDLDDIYQLAKDRFGVEPTRAEL